MVDSLVQNPTVIDTMSRPSSADVTLLSNGDYLVSWLGQSVDTLEKIYFQRFSATGVAQSPILNLPTPASSRTVEVPVVMPLPDGGFAIGSYFDNGDRGFAYSVYSATNNLISGPTQVGEPRWAYSGGLGGDNFAYANGYLINVSHSETGGTGGPGEGAWDVNIVLKDANGSTVFTGKAAANNFGAQINSEVIPLADGVSFLITWADNSGVLDNSGYGLYGRVFSTATQSFTTDPFLVNQLTAGSQAGWNGEVSTVSLPDGGFAAFWVNDVNAGIYRASIAAGQISGRIFSLVNGSYQPAGDEFILTQTFSGNQNYINASPGPNGNILTIFSVTDASGITRIIVKVLDQSGAVVKPEHVISSDADSMSLPDITWLSDGSAVAIWSKNNVETATVGDRSLMSQTISADLLVANSAPTINSNGGGDTASISIAENETAIATITATDVDPNTTLSYSISGGADAALFDINAATGALSFKAAPNFEAPADLGANNIYDVVVQVSDGTLTDAQAITVAVNNANEPSSGTLRLLKAGPIGELGVNTYTNNDQWAPAAAALLDGGWVVTWNSNGQDGSDWGVFGQRYDAAGKLLGSEFRVNTNTLYSQTDPAITGLPDGGWLVTWSSYGQEGPPLGAYGIYSRRYNASGQETGNEFQVNTYTLDQQTEAAVAVLADGGWVVTWNSNGQDGSSWGVFGQRYSSDGNPIGSEFQVNLYSDGYQIAPAIAALPDGGWLISWTSEAQDGSSLGLFGRRYREFRRGTLSLFCARKQGNLHKVACFGRTVPPQLYVLTSVFM